MLIEDDILEQVKLEIKRLRTEDLIGLFELYIRIKFSFDISSNRQAEIERLLQKLTLSKDKEIDIYKEALISKDDFVRRTRRIDKDIQALTLELDRIVNYDRQDV
ncbi:hypothetical protein PCCS19_05880 [Paenibacillus sp. CCS19]|uniref:hypothetical protein n=1 Tax=Paenibacillus sp. CCS19 TaxID=3158387 RepID=UPI00256C2A8C|nr:hypothetical protein [Paenibacillus cellulosilyticus]GMK37534.1 hypothetical protein PCCS19_05880 [Paenibacillus cellulosilyticus]